MKKTLVFLIILVVFSFLSLAEAKEVLQMNEAGEVKSIERSEALHSLTESEIKAFNNPGQDVPTGSNVLAYKRVDFWYMVPTNEYSEAIVFKDGKMQTISKNIVIDGQWVVAGHVVLCLMSIGLMAISNLLVGTGKNSDNTVGFISSLTFIPLVLAICFALNFGTVPVVVFLAIDFVTGFVALYFGLAGNNKRYWKISFVFYLCIIVTIFI